MHTYPPKNTFSQLHNHGRTRQEQSGTRPGAGVNTNHRAAAGRILENYANYYWSGALELSPGLPLMKVS